MNITISTDKLKDLLNTAFEEGYRNSDATDIFAAKEETITRILTDAEITAE